MKNKLMLLMFALFVGIVLAVVLTAASKSPPKGGGANCKDLEEIDAKIFLSFSLTNQYRKVGYETYIPQPDMRWGDTPGQNPLSQSNFYCTVSVTSPNCSSFQWYGSFENVGYDLDIKLPPIGFNATIKVVYIERGEDGGTFDFNIPSYTGSFPIPQNVSYAYSRIRFEAQKTVNIAGAIFFDLEPTHNEGYNISPATGQIAMPPGGGKADFSDISGINVYIASKNMNFTGN